VDLTRRLSGIIKRNRPPHDGILEHYRGFWGADRIEEVHWTPEHLGSRLPDFHIAKVRPQGQADMWTFASIGAWRATEGEPSGLEFVAVSRGQSAAVMANLGMVAYYHAGPPENRLGLHHLLTIGSGWVEGSTLESVLVSRPYPWGPKLEHCQLPDRHIQIVWLLPITTAEHAFAREHGVNVLEERLEVAEVDYLDPSRPSVI
jgi:hypothetical protein